MIYINEKTYEDGYCKNGVYFNRYERDVACSSCGTILGKQEAIVDKSLYSFTSCLASQYVYCYRCGHKLVKT